MFFPYLRGKQYELLALRDMAENIFQNEKIFPIIEPVKINQTTAISLDIYNKSQMPFGMIVNPLVGDFKNNHHAIKSKLINDLLLSNAHYSPALIITRTTSTRDIKSFLDTFKYKKCIVIYKHEPRGEDFKRLFLNSPQIAYHIYLAQTPEYGLSDITPQNKNVIIKDCFIKAERNADYGYEDFFSSCHIDYPDSKYAHFGNYSIAGNSYSEGGRAHAITLHHIYINESLKNELYVRHYVSDRTKTPDDPGGKFLEALTKLVNDIGNLGAINTTPVCDEYINLYIQLHYPNLGPLKQLAIKHHLYLMDKLL